MPEPTYRKVRCPVCHGSNHFECFAQKTGVGSHMCDSCSGNSCPLVTTMDECDTCGHTGWVYEKVGTPEEEARKKQEADEKEAKEWEEVRAIRRERALKEAEKKKKRDEAAKKRRYQRYLELKAEFGED